MTGMYKTNKTLAGVVVTCNRLPKLKSTMARLLASPPSELAHLIILNNASSDGTKEWLNNLDDPRLVIIHETENTGGAGGFARGIREAVERFDPDWIMVTDDDGRPAPGALATFQNMDIDRYDGIAAAVYFPNGDICEMNRPSRNPFWHMKELLQTCCGGRGGFHLNSDHYNQDTPTAIDVTSFVGFFISRNGIKLAGYPDPNLFIYGDDGLYTLGLAARGGKICFDPRIKFEHDMATFNGLQRGPFEQMWKLYYYHRNLLFLYRAAAGWLFWPALLIILPKWAMKIRAYPQKRKAFIRLMQRAVLDGLSNRRKVPHSIIVNLSR